MELSTIKELCDKIKSGEIDESKLTIMLDRDDTYFYIQGDKLKIKECEMPGSDIEILYKLLFPKASIGWV